VLRPPLVLAYHGLGRFPRTLDPFNLMVAPETFRAQVRWLRRRGYRFVPLAEFVAGVRDAGPRAGTCVLTFDDGTEDNASVLLDILERERLPASIFVCPGLLGEPHFAMPAEAGVRLMTAEELRALAARPLVDLGSHTRLHTDLSEASAEEALEEMTASKSALEEIIARPVTAFAYPKAGYSAAAPDAARRAGYHCAVTSGDLGGWTPYDLRREPIDSLDGRLTFELKTRGLWKGLRSSAPGVALRRIARPLRHPG
jgi:peptidoglycan/xylan/chitin deacetylase (PgdA/CDA1 family)